MKIQVILAGIGGQGILFMSKLFSELGLKLGLNVIGAETHGMSQRGGSVIAHLKLGDFHSPLIREGRADILYSLEENETYRRLNFLRPGGICFANIPNTSEVNKKVLNYLEEREITLRVCDASGVAVKLGSALYANIVLIGYSIGTGLAPFKYDEVKSILTYISKKEYLETNLSAFDVGFKLSSQ